MAQFEVTVSSNFQSLYSLELQIFVELQLHPWFITFPGRFVSRYCYSFLYGHVIPKFTTIRIFYSRQF